MLLCTARADKDKWGAHTRGKNITAAKKKSNQNVDHRLHGRFTLQNYFARVPTSRATRALRIKTYAIYVKKIFCVVVVVVVVVYHTWKGTTRARARGTCAWVLIERSRSLHNICTKFIFLCIPYIHKFCLICFQEHWSFFIIIFILHYDDAAGSAAVVCASLLSMQACACAEFTLFVLRKKSPLYSQRRIPYRKEHIRMSRSRAHCPPRPRVQMLAAHAN